MDGAYSVASDSQGDIFVADEYSNRVQEIAAATHTQFGIAMTAGDVYTVAGSQAGYMGVSGDGGKATSALLNQPAGVAFDGAGNLYIADSSNNRIQEVSAATGNISTIAGSASGTAGDSGNGGPATSALLQAPSSVAIDQAGNVLIADTVNCQVREVPAADGTHWGQAMTAGDIYTIAGDTVNCGDSGDGGSATSALLMNPDGIAVDAAGNIYIAEAYNNQVREIAAVGGTHRGQEMSVGDIYTVAGNSSGTSGNSGDGGKATSALLNTPGQIAIDFSGNLYIADSGNNRVREVAGSNGTQWGTAMTAGDIYNVAGSPAGTSGLSGDGGPATSALMGAPSGIGTDLAGDLFIGDFNSSRLREVTATSAPTFPESPIAGGVTVTQPGGAQVTFYPQVNGTCTAPFQIAGGYCTLPQDVAATLTYNSTTSTYTFIPSPGITYTYGWNGVTAPLTSITDAAGNTLGIGYGTPAPGTANCPSSAASCRTVTAANGRSLVIGVNSSGLVTSVTDPMGRGWTYTYTNSDLTSATDPMGNKTSYTYGQGSTGNPQLANDLLTISKPNAQSCGPDAGDSTVNVYDGAGRVISQSDPMGFKTTFDYSGLNTSTGNGVTSISDPDGNTSVYGYTQGAVTSRSAWTGTTLTSEQDFDPDLGVGGTGGGTLLDTATADGDANVTSYSYDAAGNTTSKTDPLGNQTTQWSTALNLDSCEGTAEASSGCSSSQTGPAAVAPGGVIAPPSSAPPAGVTYTQYDTLGNALWTDTGVYQPGASTASYQQASYTLYKGNSVTLNGATITCNATPPSPSLPCAKINPDGVATQLAYSSYGDITSTSTPDGNGSEQATTTDAYNADGQQTSATSPIGNLPGANAGNYTTTTAYNNDGEQTTLIQAGGAGATVTPRQTGYGYDANGNQTSVTDARGYVTTHTYNADDRETLVTDPDGNSTLTCYDGDGNAAQTVPPVGVAANNLNPASCPTSYPAGYGNRLATDATVTTFSATGEHTRQTAPAPAGQSGDETTTYAYDGAGNPTATTAPAATGAGQTKSPPRPTMPPGGWSRRPRAAEPRPHQPSPTATTPTVTPALSSTPTATVLVLLPARRPTHGPCPPASNCQELWMGFS